LELYLGTGGFTNPDWLGLLYPSGTKPAAYLRIYAEHFNAVELNSSFYGLPGVKAFEGMVRNSSAQVRFSVKLHQKMTHSRDAGPDLYRQLLESVQPLRDAGMLGPFLAQFPYSFHRTPANRRYLKELVDHFTAAGETLAVEFRNQAWHIPEVSDSFRQLGLVSVSVDYPQVRGMPAPELLVSSDIAYVRLHGRNEEKWYGGKNASERHDYLYTPDELRTWVQWIMQREADLSQLYLFFLNTTRGHAITNLRMLRDLFAEYGVEAPVRL
jgi:uncharacterized protein YecE (DUF72 family)